MITDIRQIDLESSVELIKALAHAVRLELLRAMVNGERSVGDIESVTGITQPTLSQQLGILRKSDLVIARREAKQVFYRINHNRLAEVSALLDAFAGTVAVSVDDPVITQLRNSGGAATFARVFRK